MIGGAADSHPSRSPGASTFENVFRWMTTDCVSSEWSDGGGGVLRKSSRYVSSSMIGTRSRVASDSRCRRSLSGIVQPVGF